MAAIKVTFPEPQFRGQTKQELGTPAIESIVYRVVKDGLTEWIQPGAGGGPRTHVTALRDKIANAIINRVASKQVLENKRKAASLGSSGLPEKLADCRTHGMNSELILVEGDSAAGPAKPGRNAEFMAILPLRGKVVNAGKASVKQVLDNAEAQALFTAMGGGSGKDFRLEDCPLRSRRHPVRRRCRRQPHPLPVAHPHVPLHATDAGGRPGVRRPAAAVHHPHRRRRVPRLLRRTTAIASPTSCARATASAENIRWSRFKGLGEMNVDELAYCALDPATRILKRLTIDDAAEVARAAEMFEVLMGNDVPARKDFLIRNSALLDSDRLDI